MITSLSAELAKSKRTYVDSVVAKVAPVTLSPERENVYLQTFFARKKGKFIKRSDYQQIGEYLLAAGVGINRCFHLMINLLEKGDVLDDLEPQEVLDFIKRSASEVKNSTEVAGNTRERRKLIQEFNMFLHDNSAYIIKDSERYTGGKDFILRGSNGSGSHATVPNWRIVYPATKLTNKVGTDEGDMSPQEYENLKLEKYSTDLSLRAVRAGKEIQELLVGSTAGGSDLADTKEARLDFTFDFEQIEAILKRNLNLNFELGFFEELRSLLKNKGAFQQNFQLLVQRQPVSDIVNRKKRLLQLQNRAKREGMEALTPGQREIVEKGLNFDNIAVERKMCHVNFSLSIIITLQEDFCRYITQTEKGPINTYALVSWFNPWSRYYLRALNQSPSGGENTGINGMPRYIVSSKNSKDMQKYRKELGYFVDEGRSDSAGITISPRGSLTYVPNAADLDMEVSINFEKAMSDYLDAAFELGLGNGVTVANDNQHLFADKEEETEKLNDKFKDISKFGGSLLTCNWDYNTIQYVSKDGKRITTQDMTGASKPTDIAIAEYLGMNMAREGERPIVTDFGKAMAHLLDGLGENSPMYIQPTQYYYGIDHRANLPERYGMLTFRTFRSLFQTFVYGITRKNLPSLSEVIKEARDRLDLVTTNSNAYEQKLYDAVLDENFNLTAPTSTPDQINTVLMELVSAAINDAEGALGSNLYRIVSEEHGMNADVEIKSHPRYFRRSESTLKDFGNVYSYFGGLVFKLYCEALLALKPNKLSTSEDVDAEGKPVPDAVMGYQLPGFNTLSTEVMPLAAMFAKYVPEAMDYIERAEDAMENMERDESIDESDLTMGGISKGAMLFPHQLDSHRTLRRKPKFAILDVSPGGGKTITLLLDIGCVIQEDPDKIRPLVICPSKLVGNWCEDMNKVANGNWNMFPLDTAIVNRWAARDEGIDGLVELMQNAPPNTIFVAGIDFVKSKPFTVSFGARAVSAYGGVEILKRVGFNYIAFDESHKAKSLKSNTHKSIKALSTMADVKYIRLATGTFVPKEIHDVVGQTALFTSSIFKSKAYFTNEFAKSDDDKETRGSFAPDAPFRVRSKLQRNVAVVAKKRKEWAFMLPSPQDFLIEVEMENMSENPASVIHRQTYLALLQSLNEEVKKVVKKNKGSGEEGEDPEEDEGDEVDDDSMFGGNLAGVDETKLQYYMQRLEQLVTDPWGDEACYEALTNAGFTRNDFMPEKLKTVISRIRGHFGSYDNGESEANGSTRKWTPGIVVRELDLVEYDGELYLARKKSEGFDRQLLPPSTTPPTADPEVWKSEARGKLIVFTRYKRSCKAVFESLPPEYKAMAVAYHGDEPNREKNLDAFKNDPNVKIIVANEQSITEGHNLQMASRIIRVDTPWTPGDYEQSTARIFRPDTAAAKLDENGNAGEMKREVIFVDWIMTANSSEVVKVARLLSRSVEVVKYEEAENPHYEELNDIALPLVSMGWDELVQGGTVDQYNEHFYARKVLNDLQKAEFHEMRTKTVAAMVPLEPTPVPENFKVMPVIPIAANQKIPDIHGYGYERFLDYLAHDKFDVPMSRDDLEVALVGLPVRTERGYGIIKGFSSVNYRDDGELNSGGKRLLDPDEPLTSSLRVVYPGDTEAYLEPVNTCHVATKVTDDVYDKVFRGVEKRKPKKSDKSRAEDRKTERKDKSKSETKTKVNTKRKKTVKENVERAERTTTKRKKRRENVRSGQRVNAGIDVIKSDQKAKRTKSGVTVTPAMTGQDPAKDMRLRIIPSMYDGYIAIHANMRDPDAESLEKFGFNHFGSYLYIEAKRYDPYWTIIEWLESQLKRQRMSLDRNTENRLDAIQDVYEEKDKMDYNVVLAAKTASSLPTFFRTRHRDLKDKTKAKAYPMILPDRVRVCFDLKTNPRIEKWAGRKIPGVPGAGWKVHEGMNIFLATSKSEAKKKLKELESAGYTITNIDKALAALDDLKLTRTIAKARGE